MSLQPPKIDPRTNDELIAQTEYWVQQYTDWQPNVVGQSDAGQALIRIFAQMASIVRDRLNQAPDKNFLAFLNLIGAQLLPPQPARVPLTFSLVEGNLAGGFVPAQTQVAAPPPPGETDEIVFETVRDLVLSTAQLNAVFVHDPTRDRYADQTRFALEQHDRGFGAFTVAEDAALIEHSLYLACDALFSLPDSKTIKLNVFSRDAVRLKALPIEWSAWKGTQWQTLKTTTPVTDANRWQIEIANFAPHPQSIHSLPPQVWIRATLTRSFTEAIGTAIPSIQQITANAQINTPLSSPERGWLNTTVLDFSKDFYPFGKQPQPNDVLYLSLEPRSAKAGATLSVEVTLSDPLPDLIRASADLTIAWEVWTGTAWQTILSTRQQTSPETLTANGTVSLTLPSTIAQSFINRESRYWLRARIVQGNYGTESSTNLTITTLREGTDIAGQNPDRKILKVSDTRGFKPNDRVEILAGAIAPATRRIVEVNLTQETLTLDADLSQAYPPGTAVMRSIDHRIGAPSLKSLQISYSYTIPSTDLTACLTCNDFEYRDRTLVAQDNNQEFQPFTASLDLRPALYLGFDSALPNRTLSLYAQVEPLQPEDLVIARGQPAIASKPQVIWEYASPSGWTSLGAIDETQAFAERGLIQFIAPTDLSSRSEFGQNGYWIRARWQQGTFRVSPRLRRLCTRTTWATQATTLEQEILGSSNGNPNQVFESAQRPVLLGQQLDVREPMMPSEAEQATLNAIDSSAIALVKDAAGQLEAIWVRWQEVPDFYQSSATDRHYTLDHYTGQIQFGNGRQGKIPPQARNSIRLTQYRTGGGERGNCSAITITQLKTTIPYVDQVSNLEAAAGGSDLEPLERAKARGATKLRHRGRAVTLQDFEDLTYESTADVARAKAIAPYLLPQPNDPRIELLNSLDDRLWLNPKTPNPNLSLHQRVNAGQLLVLIVPKSVAAQPTPSLALIDQVETYLRDRASATLELKVTAPIWRKVSVTAEVVPASLERADQVVKQIRDRLDQFLHPLIGGSGSGWEFGRAPHDSDFYALIESIPNVDYVTALTVAATEIPPNISIDQVLVYSGTHSISLRFS